MPQPRLQTGKESSVYQKEHTQESNSRETTPTHPGHGNPSHYSGTHSSSAEHSSTLEEVDLVGITTEFQEYMENIRHRIDRQPHDSLWEGFSTLGLWQVVGSIIEFSQYQVISDLEDEELRLKTKLAAMWERLGDPGIPATPDLDTYKMILYAPCGIITNMVLKFSPRDVQWTMSNTWDAIWQMFPEDTEGILACIQENIYLEAFKPCDVPDLEIYLPRLIISATVLPIAFDFDHYTIQFLGDDKIQQCLANLQKSIIDNTDTMPYDVHCVRAYAIFALRKDPQRFERERAKSVDALARTLHGYLRPLGIIEGLKLKFDLHLRDAINCAAETGLELAQFRCSAVARKNGCRPGDHFDPRLMTARFICPGSVMESRLVEEGARVAIVLSPLFVKMRYKRCGQPWDVENMEIQELSRIILQKGNVVCYIMKEGKEGGKSVEFPG
ncbi:hypothetical protein L211DRAFT_844860 [Terfezia boudieri ATCC MYA-4762]|uniref:Uncharacterized protein n=1 Tax=Terfezia boudieri ATCC MYA-4762 TaxID=1051890 RepID=A0A3N4M7F8_9PEZI|nr:hypothetical protein L211DRAFT_844860 [Terfezia boudieri ATCC MYA-4762]